MMESAPTSTDSVAAASADTDSDMDSKDDSIGSSNGAKPGQTQGPPLRQSVGSPKSTKFWSARIWASLDPFQTGTHKSSPLIEPVA